ncbi:MAG TPA: outer membrane beta-barrel protein [Paludibacteraceae bacterium]|nr:outer membrane beta-barrel protein [Paludibacteraceae bacterium]HOL28841.1 outer membrane beta-barrel protein [Paludibacteraceae bacterium]HPQ12281.1 outer membrane beta-barrel protein [Paludibacteraceae bacterium]
MRKIFFFLSLFFFPILIQAQTFSGSALITGKLIDKETKKPVPLANIRVLQQRDSSFVNGQASRNDGSFSIPVHYGSYIVHISFLGYDDVFKHVQVSASNPIAVLDTIFLRQTDFKLSEVIITEKAPEVRVKGDTLEFNAGSFKVTESAVVEDLLKKMPGVEIDKDGKITVNGREIKKIMVDGKEFFSSDPKVASKNLPAKMVEKVQVLDKKSEMAEMTGFDDSDEETVINLVIKQGMKEGLIGNAFAGYGSKDRYEGNAMVNYMRNQNQFTFIGGLNNTNNAGFTDLASSMFGNMGGRGMRGMFGNQDGVTTSGMGGFNFNTQLSQTFKLGGNVRYGSTNSDVLSKIRTQNMLSSGNTFENENDTTNSFSQNFNMDLRMEWTPDTVTRIIFRPSVGVYENSRDEISNFNTTNEENDSINKGDSKYSSDGNGYNVGGRLEVSRQLGKKGRVLSLQLRGQLNDADNEGYNLSNTYYFGTKPDDIIDQKFTNTSNSKNWQSFLSYVEPIGHNNFIQLAYNYQQKFSESNKDTRTKDDLGNYSVMDTTYSKRLENDFVNQSIEMNFKANRGKYDYMFGFSMQPFNSSSKTYKGDSLYNNTSNQGINYAPSAQFNYRWSRQNNLRIRYSGITSQPSVTQLSPVRDVSNPLNVTYGNPDLKPSFSHQLNIRYMNFMPQQKSSINFFGNASYTLNDIVSSTSTDVFTGQKETTYKNVNGNWNANGRLTLNLPIKKTNFSVFSMSSGSYTHSKGYSNNEINLSQRTGLGQTLGIDFRSGVVDFGTRGNINYNNIQNSLTGQQDQEYFNYNVSANTTIYLPYDLSIDSDLSYNTNSGYSTGFEQEALIWNASLQKQLFKHKNGSLRLKIYDILQQKSNISRRATANYITDTTTNTLTSYFIVHFVYRFNIFKNGANQNDMMPHRSFGGGPSGH